MMGDAVDGVVGPVVIAGLREAEQCPLTHCERRHPIARHAADHQAEACAAALYPAHVLRSEADPLREARCALVQLAPEEENGARLALHGDLLARRPPFVA